MYVYALGFFQYDYVFSCVPAIHASRIIRINYVPKRGLFIYIYFFFPLKIRFYTLQYCTVVVRRARDFQSAHDARIVPAGTLLLRPILILYCRSSSSSRNSSRWSISTFIYIIIRELTTRCVSRSYIEKKKKLRTYIIC